MEPAQDPTPKKPLNKLLLIIPLVLLLLVASGIFLLQDKLFPIEEDEDNSQVSLAEPEKDCEGTFYDTHLHIEEDDPGKIALQMQQHQVGCAVAFVNMDPDNPEETFDEVTADLEDLPGRFVPFFHVDPKKPADVERSRLEKVLNKYPSIFKGFGETAFYREPWVGQSLNTPSWDGVFELAREKDIFVMIHLRNDQASELETMLKKHPQTKVLVHGPELREDLPQLLKNHENLYYTLDTATLITIGDFPSEILMYPQNMQKGDFSKKYAPHKKAILKDSFSRWETLVTAAPDRVMWGTDASLTWHSDQDVYSKLIEFSNEFIKMLAEEHQKSFARENALKLFGKGISFE